MRRTILTLATLAGLTVICATTAQAGTSMAIGSGLASQTLARHGNYGRHHGGYHGRHHGGYQGRHHGGYGRHHGGYGRHHGGYYGYPAVYVTRPYVHHVPYNSFYYSGRGFSFGFGF